MSEGGNVGGRKSKQDNASDEDNVSLCAVCIEKKRKTEADKFCTSCSDYYCAECIKLHDVVPALRGHVILGAIEYKRHRAEGKILSMPTKRCTKHSTKIVDMYCKTHDEVGCASCFALEHNSISCKVMFIPEHITTLFSLDEVIQAENNLSTFVKKLKAELMHRHKSKTELYELKLKAKKEIDIYVDEIFAAVGELKKETTSELDKLFHEVDTLIDEQSLEIQASLTSSETDLEDLKNANNTTCNKSQQYVCSRLARLSASKCKDLNEYLKCPAMQSITFIPHISCNDLFQQLAFNKTLGAFSTKQALATSQFTTYIVENESKAHCRMIEDFTTCSITGSCFLTDGTILLTDRANHRLKRLLPNQTTVNDYLSFPVVGDTPWSVCAIGPTEAATTLSGLKQVHFVSVGMALKKRKTLKLDFKCYGIAYHEGELFVSDNSSRVYIYTTAGKLLRQLDTDDSENKSFSDIRNMAIGESGSVLYVADWHRGLIAVDTRTRHVAWRFKLDHMEGTEGVCVDELGSVFVCGNVSNNILQVSEKGKEVKCYWLSGVFMFLQR